MVVSLGLLQIMFRVQGSDQRQTFSRKVFESQFANLRGSNAIRTSPGWQSNNSAILCLVFVPEKTLRYDKDALLQRLCLLSENGRCSFRRQVFGACPSATSSEICIALAPPRSKLLQTLLALKAEASLDDQNPKKQEINEISVPVVPFFSSCILPGDASTCVASPTVGANCVASF